VFGGGGERFLGGDQLGKEKGWASVGNLVLWLDRGGDVGMCDRVAWYSSVGLGEGYSGLVLVAVSFGSESRCVSRAPLS